jgi:hypothetical protein
MTNCCSMSDNFISTGVRYSAMKDKVIIWSLKQQTCPTGSLNFLLAISTWQQYEQALVNFIKIMYRVSPLWTPKSQQKKYVGSSPQYSDAPVYRRHRDQSQQTTTSAPAPIISRVSRVMQTDSSDSLLHQPPPPAPFTMHPQHHKLPDGETVVRVYQVCVSSCSSVLLILELGDPQLHMALLLHIPVKLLLLTIIQETWIESVDEVQVFLMLKQVVHVSYHGACRNSVKWWKSFVKGQDWDPELNTEHEC